MYSKISILILIYSITIILQKKTRAAGFFKRIGLEKYDKRDSTKFDSLNEMRLKAGLDILQYSDKLMILAQNAVEAMAKSGDLSNPIPSITNKKIHARALKYIGEIATTGHWMGNYKCFDNFLDQIYKAHYNLLENCLTSTTLFTEYGYGRVHDKSLNLYVVQMYSFQKKDGEGHDTDSYTSENPNDDSSKLYVLKYKNQPPNDRLLNSI